MVETYPELMEVEPFELPLGRLDTYLSAIVRARSLYLSRDEWLDWLLYLLPRLAPYALSRHHRELSWYPFQSMVTAFMVMYPENTHGGSELTDDVLDTLGKALMKPWFWDGEGPDAVLRESEAFSDSSFSAGVFLYLKYLAPEQIVPWVGSVLSISDARWRAMVLEWVVRAIPFLHGKVTSTELFYCRSEYDRPNPHWSLCESLDSEIDLVPEGNRVRFWEHLKEELTEARVLDWFDSFTKIEGLEEELKDLPERFVGAFFPHNQM